MRLALRANLFNVRSASMRPASQNTLDEWMDEKTAVYNSLSEKVNRLRPPLEEG